MKIILQEKIAKLGEVGDQVSVKPGYGRNYLLPQQKAVLATLGNIAEFEKRRAELEKAAKAVLEAASVRAAKLEKLAVTIEAQAGEEGKLFGSVGPRDIAGAITAAGVEITKSEIRMPEGPIRQTGDYDITVDLHSEVCAVVKIKVAGGASK